MLWWCGGGDDHLQLLSELSATVPDLRSALTQCASLQLEAELRLAEQTSSMTDDSVLQAKIRQLQVQQCGAVLWWW